MTSTDFSQSQRPWRILIWHTPSGRSKSSLATGKKSTDERRGKKRRGKRGRGEKGKGSGEAVPFRKLYPLTQFPYSPFPSSSCLFWNPRPALACNPQKSIR